MHGVRHYGSTDGIVASMRLRSMGNNAAWLRLRNMDQDATRVRFMLHQADQVAGPLGGYASIALCCP
ncbi:hypothetical protein HUB98_20515 [Paenibacillus barcinonensis]|uniref:Uncharacterized protein n=1 Tax=Paenibacillus barcinonensis TaxID=198119 RepID=A0ABX6Q849_PAEBA|nr:hypothetical protein [Paenibacillus barcinonensis]QKS58384.1 hypothetical protein HUB98_20515 [Paenibacillus barcinonensis]